MAKRVFVSEVEKTYPSLPPTYARCLSKVFSKLLFPFLNVEVPILGQDTSTRRVPKPDALHEPTCNSSANEKHFIQNTHT